jgi:hypothetical protein
VQKRVKVSRVYMIHLNQHLQRYVLRILLRLFCSGAVTVIFAENIVEKLIVARLVKELEVFYETRRFITT